MLLNIFKHYPQWTCWFWTILIAIAVVHEIAGLLRWNGAIPLTWFIRDIIPTWLRWMLMGWLLYHFGVETNQNQPLK